MTTDDEKASGQNMSGKSEDDNCNSQASGASVNQRYEEALSHLCLSGRMNQAVAFLEDLPQLCLALVSTILEFTPAENCSIMLNDPDTGNLQLLVAKGKDDDGSFLGSGNSRTTILKAGQGLAGWAIRNEEIVRVADCESDRRFIDLESSKMTINSVICAPIVSQGNVIGVFNCSHAQKGRFSDDDREKVSIVANHAAVLLQSAMNCEELRKGKRKLELQLCDEDKQLEETRGRLEELESQLFRSEAFATLGELMAGVAHELNNRVAPMLVCSQMLQQSTNREKDEKRLRIIEESAKGAKAILDTLLGYSNPGKRDQKLTDLNETVEKTLSLVEYQLRKHGVEVMLDLSPDIPDALVNERQIAQVLLNIINNAIHSMEHSGGVLAIQSSFDYTNVTLTISDSGSGIPEDIAEKVFEPFFTTKEPGKGTGLGLSMSKRYVEEQGGRISVCSASSCGARLIIEIPRAKGDEGERVGNHSTLGDSSNNPRILVVDDDSMIRDVIRDVLGPRYSIEFAIDGRDAAKKIEDDLFDLLMVDYHMPGFDGKQLYEWLTANRPSLKNRVVFSTGDIYSDDTREFIEGTGCQCLIKPFSTTNLREVVSGALQS